MKRLAISAGLTLAVSAALGTVPAAARSSAARSGAARSGAARSGAARSGAVQAGEGGRYVVVLKSDATTDPVSVTRSAGASSSGRCTARRSAASPPS